MQRKSYYGLKIESIRSVDNNGIKHLPKSKEIRYYWANIQSKSRGVMVSNTYTAGKINPTFQN
jgi:hypothetical protein